MKYVKKPVIVQAFQFGVDEWPEWFRLSFSDEIRLYEDMCLIPTLEGYTKVYKGDFIIKGIKGEIYPCKEDIFKETYKPYEEDDYVFMGRYQEKKVMENKIIIVEIGEPTKGFFSRYDDFVVPLTEKQEKEIEEAARKAAEEFKDFCKEDRK